MELFTPYLCLMLLLVCLIVPYRRMGKMCRKRLLLLLFVLFCLFFGLRGDVGIDYTHYESFYYHLSASDFLAMPAFSMLVGFLNLFILPYTVFVFIVA